MTADIIAGVYGLPGTGKTTLMASIATHALSGRSFLGIPPKDRVFSNVPIPGTYVLTADMIGVCDLSNALILIDEACQWFDSRSWKTMPKCVSDFFQTIRHEHSSIVMFYQCFNDVDVRFRSLCSQHFLLFSFWDFTVVKPIVHKQDIYNFRPDDRYCYDYWYNWRLVYRPRYYHLFDSYIRFRKYDPVPLTLHPGENSLVKPRLFDRILSRIKHAPRSS